MFRRLRILDLDTANKGQPKSAGVRRRRLLRLATLVTAFTGASAISTLDTGGAQAAPGDKNAPANYIPVAEKGAAAGVATLDSESKILSSQLPDLAATFVPQSVIDTTQLAHATQITVRSDSVQNGMRIVNAANSYGLKVDQSGAGGAHDAVNIAANFIGAHTPFSVNSSNTTFSTMKIVNAASQTGGAVIAGVGSSATRTAQIIQADNSGSGASFLATQQPGSTGPGVQVQYQDSGAHETYASRAVWVQARHTSGDVVYIENASNIAQTSGSLMSIVQPNIGSTAPCLTLSPFGAGPGLKINASGASILLQVGNNYSVDSNGTVRPSSIVNGVSFNNASITPGTTGTTVTRNVADGQPVLRVKNTHATSTGDIVQFMGVEGSTIAARVDKNGYLMTRKNTPPSDADLAVGEAAIWIDPTPGTGGVRWKIKAADGSIINKTL